MGTTETIKAEKSHLESSLKKLRPLFPGLPDSEILLKVLRNGQGELNPESLETYARDKKRFTTADIMQFFSVSKYAVAGSVAVLRRAGKLTLDDPEKDDLGYACWRWSGKK